MPERKYTSRSAKYCTSVRTKCLIRDGMVGPMGIRNNDVQQSKNSEKMEEGAEISQEVPRNMARAVGSRRSRRSGQKLPRRLATLPVLIWSPIHIYP